MKVKVIIRGRQTCQECHGLGYTVARNEEHILTATVCGVCSGFMSHPSVLVVPCVDLQR